MNIIASIITALASIWRNKLTSLLAILGVVIGVTSVSTLVSVGEGLKKDVANMIQGMGTNVLVVISGKMDLSNPQSMNQSNPASFISSDILTEKDVVTIKDNPNIEAVSPLTMLVGEMRFGDKKVSPTITGVYPSILQAMQIISIDNGTMFEAGSHDKVAVLGPLAKKELFGDQNPIGEKVQIGKYGDFTVVGSIAETKSSAAFASDIESIVAIPFDTAKDLNNGEAKILRIISKAKDDADVARLKKEVTSAVVANHKGEEDFTIMTQDDILDLFGSFLNMATALVSAIAAISVIVGGIGIMNIMLVAVTERTREIGIRKAVGATNGAIMLQFLIESVTITCLGGALGLALTFVIAGVVKAKTSLTPSVTPSILIFAVALSVGAGIIFGLLPAIRAARKNPVEALRYE